NNGTARISSFNGTPNQDAARWLEEFDYVAATNNWSDKARIDRLPLYLEGIARDWYNIFVKNKRLKWIDVEALFKRYFLPSDYSEYLKAQMLQRLQRIGELTAHYVCAKLALCYRYNEQMTEEEVLKHVMQGLHPDISRSVLMQDPKTIDQLLKLAEMVEKGQRMAINYQASASNISHAVPQFTTAQISGIGAQSCQENRVQKLEDDVKDIKELLIRLTETKIQNRNPPSRQTSYYDRNTRSTSGNPRCFICKRIGHLARSCCYNRNGMRSDDRDFRQRSHNQAIPQYNENYDERGSVNDRRHVAFGQEAQNFEMRASPRQSPHRSPSPSTSKHQNKPQKHVKFEESAPKAIYSSSIHENEAIATSSEEKIGKLIHIDVEINNNKTSAVLDTGAVKSIISEKLVQALHLKVVPYIGAELRAVNNSGLNIVGKASTEIFISERNAPGKMKHGFPIELVVASGTTPSLLLGQDFLELSEALIDCKEHSVKFLQALHDGHPSHVHSKEDIVIPKRSRKYIRVAVAKRNESTIGLITTSTKTYARHGLTLANSLVKLEKGETDVEVMNVHHFSKNVKAGTI
ncbi:hypothetical protein B4U79_17084, partial [Dinothrombium tinctorium]